MNRLELAEMIHDETIAHDGSTRNMAGDKPSRGFMVGGNTTSKVMDRAAFSAWSVAHYVRDHETELSYGLYVGTWTHSHMVWMDVSDNIMTMREALNVARDRGELAVWDVVNGKEIPIATEVLS
jgi:hypothetical protein